MNENVKKSFFAHIFLKSGSICVEGQNK